MNAWRLDTTKQTMIIASNGGIPFVAYWDIKLPNSDSIDQILNSLPRDFSGGVMDSIGHINFCPTSGDGFLGQPGIIVNDSNGDGIIPKFEFIKLEKDDNWSFISSDKKNGLLISHNINISGEIFMLETILKSDQPIRVGWLSSPVMPDHSSSEELIQVSGNWCNEFCFDHLVWKQGVVVKESRAGRTSHDNFPGLVLSDKSGSNVNGTTTGFHYGWSGGHRMQVEELSNGQRQIQFGHSQSMSNELTLEAKAGPLFITKSKQGINGVAGSFQSFVRKNILSFDATKSPRLVHYNCWESIYFDHNLRDLKEIAKLAASFGAERFVLDDGWFGKRDDDTSSLGDWDVDKRKYPDGLPPLIDYVYQLGMDFGIWIEPEMISPNSELYRNHPDWVHGEENQLLGRNQLVLDLSKVEVCIYLYKKISKIFSENNISYVKWDHNRILSYPDQSQANGFYSLLDKLRSNFPNIEFESCSSGGGRIDYGVLSKTHRVWLSDSNDALVRFKMQNNASVWLPSEVVGSHVGPRKCHTSGRILSMTLRAWVAASRHMGFEMDPRELTDDEVLILKDITQWYKENRCWMHNASLHRLDLNDENQLGEIQVSNNNRKFVSFIVQMEQSAYSSPKLTPLCGLEPDAIYKISLKTPENAALVSRGDLTLKNNNLKLSGQFLMSHGINLPCAFPGSIWVIEGNKV